MRYSVKQLATIAKITTRTLHYYDEIGLLCPQRVENNGYRSYVEEDLLRLQQILFFRKLDVPLEQIKTILDRPNFDLLQALQGHRAALQAQQQQLNSLIETVDNTIKHIQGEITMSQTDFYAGFDEEQQKAHAVEAESRWGETAAKSQKKWERLSRDEKNALMAESDEINRNLAASMEHGARSAEAQQWIARFYQFINHFYPCSLEIFENLGHMYMQDGRFTETYEKQKAGMAAFMEEAVTYYCQVAAKDADK